MNCQNCREAMADSLYGVLTEEQEQAFEHHLQHCEACALDFAELRAALTTIEREKPEFPEPPSLESLWSDLEPELDRIDQQRRRFWLKPAMAAFAAALILAILFLPQAPPVEPLAEKPKIDQRLASFYNRTQPVLLAIANDSLADEDEILSDMLEFDKMYAAQLAEEAGALSEVLADQTSLKNKNLLEDIQLILLQVSNLRESEYHGGLRMVRHYMDQQTILFKISLLTYRQEIS